MLFVDVNIGKDRGMKRLVIYEQDDSAILAEKFASKYNLPENKQRKLEVLLQQKVNDYKKKKLS